MQDDRQMSPGTMEEGQEVGSAYPLLGKAHLIWVEATLEIKSMLVSFESYFSMFRVSFYMSVFICFKCFLFIFYSDRGDFFLSKLNILTNNKN